MSDQDNQARLSRLEAEMPKVQDLLREVREGMIRVEERLKNFSTCPSPGACVELRRLVNEHQKFIDQAQGAGTLAKILWAVLGVAGAGALVRYIAGK
jgi:hypothetical protein